MDYEYNEQSTDEELIFIWLAREDTFYDFKTVWESWYIETFDMRIFTN